MTVHCPLCTRGYRLAEHLMGSAGARVHCPGCGGSFVVRADPTSSAAQAPARPTLAESLPDAASGGGPPAGPTARPEWIGGRHSPAVQAQPTAARMPPPEDPASVAGAVLDVLTDFLGDSLGRARTRGTVLSEHGPAIMAVWDEYRRRAGEDAPPAIFRTALRDRCGVNLSPRLES